MRHTQLKPLWILRGVLAVILSVLAARAFADFDQPNMVLFIADDLNWNDVGPLGNQDVRTPHLDRLAGEGMTFTRMFTGTAMCAPTRQQLFTGLYPVRNGAFPNHGVVYEGTRSMVHHLADRGYRVALKGKRHYGPPESFPFEYLGGMHHDPGPRAGPDLDLERARSFIESAGDDPWCLVVATNQPHTPWNRGAPGAYAPDELTLPPNLVDTRETREALTRYYGEITYMDDQLGEVIGILGDTGAAGDTVVIWTSEQGSGLPFAKWTNYDAGLRISTIVRWPDEVEPGSRTGALVEYVDVVPTLVEMAGGDPDAIDTGRDGAPDGGRGFDGESFLPVLLGETDRHKKHVFGIQTTRGIHRGPEAYPIRSVRDERYKLIWNIAPDETFRNLVTEAGVPHRLWENWREAAEHDPRAAFLVERYQNRPEFELYDLENDPHEMTNLYDAAEDTVTVRRLREKLESWMARQGDRGLETELGAGDRQIEDRLLR